VAKFLQGDPRVAWVNYPGLPTTSIFRWQRNIFRKARRAAEFRRQGRGKAGERFIEAAQFMSHLANIATPRRW